MDPLRGRGILCPLDGTPRPGPALSCTLHLGPAPGALLGTVMEPPLPFLHRGSVYGPVAGLRCTRIRRCGTPVDIVPRGLTAEILLWGFGAVNPISAPLRRLSTRPCPCALSLHCVASSSLFCVRRPFELTVCARGTPGGFQNPGNKCFWRCCGVPQTPNRRW